MAQYDPKRVTVSFNGQPLLGFADGTWLTADRRNDSIDMYVGSTGEYIAAVNQDRSGTVSLSLTGSSQSNDFLESNRQDAENGAQVPGVLLIVDLNGRTELFSNSAYVSKPPSVTYGKAGGDMNRDWMLVCGELDFHVGGANLL